MIKVRKGNRFSRNDRRAKALLEIADAAKEWHLAKQKVWDMSSLSDRRKNPSAIRRLRTAVLTHLAAEIHLERSVRVWMKLGG